MDIVFVHLNTNVPKYLRLNIESHIKRFPNHKVTLIYNEGISIPQIENLNLFEYKPRDNWQILESFYQHEKNFRGNFWLTSTARLFALEAYLEEVDREILHLESDVVISTDFPFEEFSLLSRDLAYPIISDPRGVASVFYSRNKGLIRELSNYILQEAEKNPKTTEMLILRNFFDENSEAIQLLPIGPNRRDSYRALPNFLWEKMSDSFQKFGGCFDGVDIGQYFFGTDPRNRRGRTLFRQDLVNGYAEVGKWNLTYSQERQFLNVSGGNGEAETKLYSLHLPSKRNGIFSLSKQESRFQFYAEKSKELPEEKIYWSTVVDSAIKSLARRGKSIFSI